jgi:hypothetical protein
MGGFLGGPAKAGGNEGAGRRTGGAGAENRSGTNPNLAIARKRMAYARMLFGANAPQLHVLEGFFMSEASMPAACHFMDDSNITLLWGLKASASQVQGLIDLMLEDDITVCRPLFYFMMIPRIVSGQS